MERRELWMLTVVRDLVAAQNVHCALFGTSSEHVGFFSSRLRPPGFSAPHAGNSGSSWIWLQRSVEPSFRGTRPRDPDACWMFERRPRPPRISLHRASLCRARPAAPALSPWPPLAGLRDLLPPSCPRKLGEHSRVAAWLAGWRSPPAHGPGWLGRHAGPPRRDSPSLFPSLLPQHLDSSILSTPFRTARPSRQQTLLRIHGSRNPLVSSAEPTEYKVWDDHSLLCVV